MTSLEEFHAGMNEIGELPSFIGRFTNLKLFGLARNRFRKVPAEIGLMRQLEVLSIGRHRASHKKGWRHETEVKEFPKVHFDEVKLLPR